MDLKNKFLNHTIVAAISFILVYFIWLTGIGLNRAVAGVSFFLLFLVLIIGPIMRIWRPSAESLPWELPWGWRGELGIWFTLLSIVHVALVVAGREAGAALRIADYLGFVALFWALVLTATSFNKVINFIGISSWKWLHSTAYVIFYLVGLHTINHAFLRSGRPDSWMHWAYLVMIGLVFMLQLSAFAKNVFFYRKCLRQNEVKM